MRYQLRHVRVVTTNLPCRFSIEQGGRCCAVENSSRHGSDSSNRGDSVGSVRQNSVGGAAEFAHYCAQEAVECVDVLRQPERSEEHTSELQSRGHLVCRLLLEKKNATTY